MGKERSTRMITIDLLFPPSTFVKHFGVTDSTSLGQCVGVEQMQCVCEGQPEGEAGCGCGTDAVCV